jgi:hypothetical protein
LRSSLGEGFGIDLLKGAYNLTAHRCSGIIDSPVGAMGLAGIAILAVIIWIANKTDM